jgi:hypothetical protein
MEVSCFPDAFVQLSKRIEQWADRHPEIFPDRTKMENTGKHSRNGLLYAAKMCGPQYKTTWASHEMAGV